MTAGVEHVARHAGLNGLRHKSSRSSRPSRLLIGGLRDFLKGARSARASIRSRCAGLGTDHPRLRLRRSLPSLLRRGMGFLAFFWMKLHTHMAFLFSFTDEATLLI